MTSIRLNPDQPSQNMNQFSIPEVQSVRGNRDPRTRGHHERPVLGMPSREIVGVHLLRWRAITLKVDLEGSQGLNRGSFTSRHGGSMHQVVIESIRVLQERK
jgi:hypothetical protein